MKRPLGGWRRVAGAMWNSPNDPQIFGAIDVEAAPILSFLERARATGARITPTHLVGRAVARALVEVPDLNVRIRRGYAQPRPSVDVFIITSVAGGNDLSGVKIEHADGKIASELGKRGGALKRGDDPEFARTKSLMERMPPWLVRPAIRATTFLTQELRIDLPKLGLHKDPFGSAMVSSVGMFGLPGGFVPLAWMYDVPLLVLVGEITEKPVVVGGRVEARRMLPVTATIDHRYVDGWHVSNLMRAFRGYLAEPERFEPELPAPAQPRPN